MGSACARQDRLLWTGHVSPAQRPSPTGSVCCVNSWGASSAQTQCAPNVLMSGWHTSKKVNASAGSLLQVSTLKVSVLNAMRRAARYVRPTNTTRSDAMNAWTPMLSSTQMGNVFAQKGRA